MFHKATAIEYREGTVLELTFRDGSVKQFDMAILFDKYPQLTALNNRELFTSGKLSGGYGVIWNDQLDIEAETIYEEGVLVNTVPIPQNMDIADALSSARAAAGISQKELAKRTGIDQSDISRIERGTANPSIATLKRIAAGLGTQLQVSFRP